MLSIAVTVICEMSSSLWYCIYMTMIYPLSTRIVVKKSAEQFESEECKGGMMNGFY